MEGSALCLVFCSTLAALVSVISVLCSRILRSLRDWAIMGTPWQFALSKAFPAMPNIGFTICHLALSFPLGVALLRVIIILPPPPPASAPLSVGPTCQLPVATRGNSGLAYRKFRQSGVP